MAYVESNLWYEKVSSVWEGPKNPPRSYGPNTLKDADYMDSEGWRKLWIDDGGASPGEYYYKVIGEVIADDTNLRILRSDTWQKETVENIRLIKRGDILDQVPKLSEQGSIIDQGIEEDIILATTAANERLLQLEETDDAAVETFDSTIQRNQTGIEDQSRFIVTIAKLTPWAGAPNNDLGWRSMLKLESGKEANGGEARIYVVSGPDAGAVLPYVQDGSDPSIWRVESRDGFKWQDETTVCSLRLLWGAGSLPVSPTLELKGYDRSQNKGDRAATIVRYGVGV